MHAPGLGKHACSPHALELLERILDTCGQGNMRRIAAGTFHSLAMAQLKRNSKSKMPRLLGDAERSALLRRCWQENASDLKFEDVLKNIEAAKAKVEAVAFSDVGM